VLGSPIRALFYDGRSSGAREITVSVSRWPEAHLTIVGADFADDVPFKALQIEPRVGDAPRFLHVPEGASIEIIDNAAFDSALQAAAVRAPEELAGGLERRWSYAIVALLATVLGAWSFITYGVPTLARRAITFVPLAVDAQVGAEGLELLDRTVLNPTRLAAARQQELRRLFTSVIADVPSNYVPDRVRYRLELRAGGAIGPNALALPSGIVILTDELARQAKHDDELRAVFAHEVGHIVHRHSMQRLVQSSAVAILMMGLFGDVSGAASLVVGIPSVLLDAAYSRELEREADAYACAWMARHQVAPERLADLLKRVTAAEGGDGGHEYLSSHPAITKRRCQVSSG
jgi:Zn-dependent protease with chaperone function